MKAPLFIQYIKHENDQFSPFREKNLTIHYTYKCCLQMIINKLSYALFRIDWVLNPTAGNTLLSLNAYENVREIRKFAF